MHPDPDPDERTERLTLWRPTVEDLDALFALNSDPRVWTHYPSLRQRDPAQTRKQITRWRRHWREDGLGMWSVRLAGTPGPAVGYGGCAHRGEVWNLGYRLAPETQGRGLASELARVACARARAREPERPIVAFMVEHNRASARVAEKLGFTLQHRAPDAGNPDPAAIRLVYADRTLTAPQLAGLLGG